MPGEQHPASSLSTEFVGLSHKIHIFPGSLQSFTITKQGMPDPHILHRTSPYDILS